MPFAVLQCPVPDLFVLQIFQNNSSPVKRVIIAIVRMIPTTVYQMLSTSEERNPSVPYKIDMPAPLLEKKKAQAIKQARKFLEKEGLLSPDEQFYFSPNKSSLVILFNHFPLR